MAFSLFPKSPKFFDLFMEQHRQLKKAASILNDLFQNFTELEDRCQRINILESDGNKISRDIAKQLSLTFITPIDREDIHDINLAQEDLLNLIKAISTRACLYDFTRVRYPAQLLSANLKTLVDETGSMLAKLAAKKEPKGEMERVKALKSECETILLVALGELYDSVKHESGAILDIVKWSHVYDRIEQAVEQAERLADALEGIMLKNA